MKTIPIKIFVSYIILTMLISFYGPMEYVNYDKKSVFIYMMFFILSMIIGTMFANRQNIVLIKTNKNKIIDIYQKQKRDRQIYKLIIISLTISLFSIGLEFVEIFFENIDAFSLKKVAENYMNLRSSDSDGSYSLATLIRFSTGFFRNISIILVLYYWKIIKRQDRYKFYIYIILLFFVNMIAYGTQKFIGDITIYLCIVLLIKKMENGKVKSNKKVVVKIVLVLIIVFTLFVFVQAQRYEMIGVTVDNFGSKSGGYQFFDKENIIFKIFGQKYGLGIAVLLTAYLSGGYYGLSLAFKLPFEWTYGVGNSYVLSKVFSFVFGIPEIYEKTYLNKLGTYFGRDGLRTWNTVFPWFASDFTFVGTLIFFCIIGYFWQKSWIEVVKYKNPVSIVFFSTISLGLLFVPANNQLLHGIDTFSSTIIIIIFWLLKHKKYNYNIEE